MITRRQLFIVTLTPLLTTGCITRQMLENDRLYYKEQVSDLLLAQDGLWVAVVGEKYHYVFDAPPGLAEVLRSNIRDKLTASFGEFSVSDDLGISGKFWIDALAKKSEQEQLLSKLGFHGPSFRREFQLKGRRYSADGFARGVEIKLNKPYVVAISEPKSALNRASRMAATPITATVDGVLILFGFPLLLIACSGKNACK
ncbi:hypothetical protein WJU27_16540 [Methyloversatilis sp. NSM2]